jgi:hypothetical protein
LRKDAAWRQGGRTILGASPRGLKISNPPNAASPSGSGRSAANPAAVMPHHPMHAMIPYRGAKLGRVRIEITTGTTTGTSISEISSASRCIRLRQYQNPTTTSVSMARNTGTDPLKCQ